MDKTTLNLSEFYENPNNPSTATDEEIERLVGKIKRVPQGLKAIRIAYVTDIEQGKKIVISGNKRLRVLKKIYGDNAEIDSSFFQDVTEMSEAERHEFIIDANVSDGHWDIEKLLDQYDNDELSDYFGQENLESLLKTCTPDSEDDEVDVPDAEVEEKEYTVFNVVISCNSEEEAQQVHDKLVDEGIECSITKF